MVFTDEPSILLDGSFGVRIEDVVVCAEGGGRVLNGSIPGRCRESDPSFWGSSCPHPLGIRLSCR